METIDGDFGPSTERAIRQFQQDFDLSVDALVGSGTAAQIDVARRQTSRERADNQNIN